MSRGSIYVENEVKKLKIIKRDFDVRT